MQILQEINKIKVKYILIAACLLTCCYFSYLLAGFTSPFIHFNTSLAGILVGIAGILFLPAVNKKAVILIISCITAAIIYYLQSRAGLLAWLAGCFVLVFSTKQFALRKIKILVFIFGVLAIAFVAAASTLFLKTNSTSGRWFIWQNSLQFLKTTGLQELIGVGFVQLITSSRQIGFNSMASITSKPCLQIQCIML